MKPQALPKVPATETKTMRARRSEVVLVSSDDAFLIELGPLLGDRYRTRTVDHPDALAANSELTRYVALIDAASISDARAAVARLEQARRGELIVVAEHPEEWNNALTRGAIHAVISRDQLTGDQLPTLLLGAEARLNNPDMHAAIATAPAAVATGTGAASARTEPSSRRLIWVAGLAVLVVALGLGALLHHHPADKPAASTASVTSGVTAPTPTDNTAKPQSVLELLSAARVAFRDQKLLLPRTDGEPRGDSALELYTQVLAQEPQNDEALDGVRRLFSVGKARIQADLSSGKLDEAVRLLASFKSAGVDADALRDIESGINAARPKWLAAKAQDAINAGDLSGAEALLTQASAAGADRNTISELRRGIDTKKADGQLAGMEGEVKAAIDAGALLDPANDNARTRLQAMRNVSRTNAATLGAQRDLQAALLTRAQEAIKKDQFELAQRYIGAAAENIPNADLSDIKHALQSESDALNARAAAASAAQARAKQAAEAASSAPSNASAAAKSSAPHYVAARPVTAISVVYPQAASDGNVEGYVIVEFLLHPDGSASDASIVEAKPAHVFDRAATSAVLRARYDARSLSGGISQRARIRLTFKPN